MSSDSVMYLSGNVMTTIFLYAAANIVILSIFKYFVRFILGKHHDKFVMHTWIALTRREFAASCT